MRFPKLLLLATAFAAGVAAAGDDARQRDDYFQALTTMTPQLSAYSFVLAQYLDMRCGRPQSLAHVQAVLRQDDASELFVILALKDGDTAKAKAILERLPCER